MSTEQPAAPRRRRSAAAPPPQSTEVSSGAPSEPLQFGEGGVPVYDPRPVPETPPDPALSGTELTLPQRARQAIGLVNIEAQLKDMAEKTATITAITNADGREQVHAGMMALKEQRIAIERAGKTARDEANRFASEVIVQQNQLIALISPEEGRLKKLRDDYDEAVAAEKRAKAEADRKRKEAINARIQSMREVPNEAVGKAAAEIQAIIQQVVAIEIDDSFEELKEHAQNTHASVLVRLRSMHGQQVTFEQQRAEAEKREQQRKAELDAEIARQKQERELNEKIRAIEDQVRIGSLGRRHPDRKAGTRECIVDTLEETRAWPITAEIFGSLLPSALAAREYAVKELEAKLQHFDQVARDREEFQRRQAEQKEADEKRRAEEQRLEAERKKLEADQQAARVEAERLEAQRVELQQQIAAATPAPAIPLEGLVQKLGLQEDEEAPAPFEPTPNDIIKLVMDRFSVPFEQALVWCFNAFDHQRRDAADDDSGLDGE